MTSSEELEQSSYISLPYTLPRNVQSAKLKIPIQSANTAESTHRLGINLYFTSNLYRLPGLRHGNNVSRRLYTFAPKRRDAYLSTLCLHAYA